MSHNDRFDIILNSAKNALLEELSRFSNESYKQEIIFNDETCFRTIIEWENCIGELIVEEAEFAPYRNISFIILSSVTKDIIPIFCWYDSEKDSLETIIEKIKEGLLIAFGY